MSHKLNLAGKDIVVRSAIETDKEQIIVLVTEFWAEHRSLLNSNYKLDYDVTATEVQKKYANPNTGYIVAVKQTTNKIVGFRRWELHDGFYFSKEMYVKPAMRKKGIAKHMIKHFEQWLMDKGQDIACISLVPRNSKMLELARSEGYTILNTIELRKNLSTDLKKPNTKISFLKKDWEVY